jgi:hypothetical protein
MKRVIVATGLLGMLSGMLAFALAQPQTPTEAPVSAPALIAIANYTAAVGKLDDDYARRLFTLRRQYIKELDSARKASLEKDDLDEAQRLLAEKKRVEAATFQPGANRGLVILCAVYGIEDQWLDITPRVRSLVRNAQFHYAPEEWRSLPEVAPGRHKSIIISYTLDGKLYVSITRDDQQAFDLPTR